MSDEQKRLNESFDQFQAMRREIERQFKLSQAAEDARKAAEAAAAAAQQRGQEPTPSR